MKKTLLSISIAFIAYSSISNANENAFTPPSKFSCTASETQQYILKISQGVIAETTITTWEDTKKMISLAKTNAKANEKINGTGSASSDADIAKTGSSSGTGSSGGDECDLMFSEYNALSSDDLFGSFGSGGIPSPSDITGMLTDAANDFMTDSMASMREALNGSVCKRMQPDAIIELATKETDKALKAEYGYDTDDLISGDLHNEVTNDILKEQTGQSNGKLFNVMDSSLDDNRDNYIKRTVENAMDDKEDEIVDNVTN